MNIPEPSQNLLCKPISCARDAGQGPKVIRSKVKYSESPQQQRAMHALQADRRLADVLLVPGGVVLPEGVCGGGGARAADNLRHRCRGL